MKYAQVFTCDVANGPGCRTSLFVSGCTHHCKDCFNEIAWDFNYGKEFDEHVQDTLIKDTNHPYIDGFTFLGGEPMEIDNQRVLLGFLRKVKERYPDKNIWCYTGCVFETELLSESKWRCECTDEILSMIDVLVDGRFVIARKNISLAFRGSDNQRIIDVQTSLKTGTTVTFDFD